jgi:hypothetical protein
MKKMKFLDCFECNNLGCKMEYHEPILVCKFEEDEIYHLILDDINNSKDNIDCPYFSQCIYYAKNVDPLLELYKITEALNIFNGRKNIKENKDKIIYLIKQARNIIKENHLPVKLKLTENLQKIETEEYNVFR